MYETRLDWAELDYGLMDMLGQGQEPTFLDWTEKELVGLRGKGLNVLVTHSRGSRRMVIKNVSL